ncbi:uncharacterized protein LOC108027538 [Drosophila biarmipes]|uniref:uncharacterized protein LOC108027538 n=1 Tax=Drosophila biarmipes TaxID=125945 RepID=UPI0007E5C135|nr:uncharacterized protein LOC108027538 [Drosophila biarmipes]
MESDEGEGERPSTSGASRFKGMTSGSEIGIGMSAILGYAQSEYSLDTSSGALEVAGRRHHESENDGNATDEEVEICITRLNFLPDRARRLYMDCQLSLPAGGSVPMRGGAETVSVSAAESSSSPEVRYERQRNTAAGVQKYWRLQKLAFACPLGNCEVVVNPGNLLSHCLMSHEDVISVEMKVGEARGLKLMGKSLPESRVKSQCVGLLIYESGRQVALNSNLPRIYTDWECRLPVLVMLWKTSWDSMPGGPRITHLYVLWLLCPQAQPPLQVAVSTGAGLPGAPRRQVIHTCSDSETIEKCDLLSDSPLYMRFTHREMKEYTGDYTQDIELQLTIHEDEAVVAPSSLQSKKDDPMVPNEEQATVEIEVIADIEVLPSEETFKEELALEKAEEPIEEPTEEPTEYCSEECSEGCPDNSTRDPAEVAYQSQ